MHECKCRICGKTFMANNKRQVICSKECKKIAYREGSAKYRERHYGLIQERKREKQQMKREAESRKPDTIVAIGYAERQMAETLKMAGRIEL